MVTLRRPLVLSLALAGTLLLGVGVLAAVRSAGAKNPSTATPLRSLTGISGETVPLGQGSGVTCLVFAARWCTPCEASVRALRRDMVHLRRSGSQLILIGTPDRQTREQFADWARSLRFEGALVYDDGGALAQAFGAQLVPWHVVIGPGGQILWTKEERPTASELQRWVSGPAQE